jgi:protein gp37
VSTQTGIEWTDATWNPVRGCSKVSEGCRNCYAMHIAARFSDPGLPYEGLAVRNGRGARWTGAVKFIEDHLDMPLRLRRPRRIFVNSMSDLFHESIPTAWIDRIVAVMALAPQHTFQVLTKRPELMRSYFADQRTYNRVLRVADGELRMKRPRLGSIPIDRPPAPNIWLGTSVEDQATANERIPALLQAPARTRFLSCEPLLGPLDLTPWLHVGHQVMDFPRVRWGLHWVIVGGESGLGARPMDLAWARSLRDQCWEADVPFFFKQVGGRLAKSGGRRLDGRTWDEYPDRPIVRRRVLA